MSKPPARTPVVLDHGGQIDFVTPGEADRLVTDGLARHATAQDLAIGGGAPPPPAPAPDAPAPDQE